jgi:hypothetical protein
VRSRDRCAAGGEADGQGQGEDGIAQGLHLGASSCLLGRRAILVGVAHGQRSVRF